LQPAARHYENGYPSACGGFSLTTAPQDQPDFFRDKVILITGGTGSFGRTFVRTVVREYEPKKVIVFSRDELKQYEMRTSGFDHPNIRYFIGDVRDAKRLHRALHGVDVVVHAAALKQVPACEYNPIEAVETNINGARNVIDAALDRDVALVLGLSTDKATSPNNLYGATKLVSEKLFVQANAYSGGDGTRFSCVRYGNVIGSRGSVVPLFREQRKLGRLTITDPRMTRFWITLEQSVRFVISCLQSMHGGEVFVPKLPTMNMLDLARAMAPECEIEHIGIRPGEKLHESMISEEEARQVIELDDRFIIRPLHPWWSESHWSGGRPVPDGFRYSSDVNDRKLTTDELVDMINA
jgi:UDP-N-acetylglucosamine 4,6-dehydratase